MLGISISINQAARMAALISAASGGTSGPFSLEFDSSFFVV